MLRNACCDFVILVSNHHWQKEAQRHTVLHRGTILYISIVTMHIVLFFQVGEIMTDLGRTHHMHDRDDLMAEQVRQIDLSHQLLIIMI